MSPIEDVTTARITTEENPVTAPLERASSIRRRETWNATERAGWCGLP